MLISAPFFSSLLYKDDTNCFLDTNHNGKLTVVRILLKVTLIILTIPILPNCVTFIWALSQVPITSSLKLIKFSTVENLSKTKINITVNVPKNLLELNALANTLLKFSNQDSFSGLKNFEILAKDGTFFMRISKTPSFYIFEIFLQVSKYFIGTWYRDSELIFVQIS